MGIFTRTAFQLKNGSRRTVVPTREIAETLLRTDPQFKYGRISTVKVGLFNFRALNRVEVLTPRRKPTTSASSTASDAQTASATTETTDASASASAPTSAV